VRRPEQLVLKLAYPILARALQDLLQNQRILTGRSR
jgi:hypothetical protein